MWLDSAMKDVAAANIFPAQTHIFLMDEEELVRRMRAITSAFNEALTTAEESDNDDTDNSNKDGRVTFLHAFAVKANPLRAVLDIARRCGFAAETASIGEFRIAERVFYPGNNVGGCGGPGNTAAKNNSGGGDGGVRDGYYDDSASSPGGMIVLDSPAKTLEELHYALQRPCYINVDNFDELDRIVALVDGTLVATKTITPTPTPTPTGDEAEGGQHGSRPTTATTVTVVPLPPITKLRAIVGIRVNPQTVEATTNASLATGGKTSKFGVGLNDPGVRDRLLAAYVSLRDKVNLRMIHVHSGSQGLSLSTMVAGVRALMASIVDSPELAAAGVAVDVVDIGGGLPVDFSADGDAEAVTIADYVAALRAEVPSLFRPTAPLEANKNSSRGGSGGGHRTIITEFGRAIAAKSGTLISRVEYAKLSGGRQIVLQHIGADLAVRTVWQPERWPLRVRLFDCHGNDRCGDNDGGGGGDHNHRDHGNAAAATTAPPPSAPRLILTDVAGPCCFSGCTLARGVAFPSDVAPLQDLVAVHDVGGYYHSSFSMYNLRQMPACYLRTTTATRGSARDDNPGRSGGGSYVGDAARLVCLRPAQTVEDTIDLFM